MQNIECPEPDIRHMAGVYLGNQLVRRPLVPPHAHYIVPAVHPRRGYDWSYRYPLIVQAALRLRKAHL